MGFEIGLLEPQVYRQVEEKYQKVDGFIRFIKNHTVLPGDINEVLLKRQSAEIDQKQKAGSLLLRPQLSIYDLIGAVPAISGFMEDQQIISPDIPDETEIIIKYESYIDKEQDLANKISSLENLTIPAEFDFKNLNSISIESREKLSKVRPATIGQASRISGVSPADISVLIVYLGR